MVSSTADKSSTRVNGFGSTLSTRNRCAALSGAGEAAPESRREGEDGEVVRRSQPREQGLGTSRVGYVGNDELRGRAGGVRSIVDPVNGVARVAQPPLEQLAHEIVRLENDDGVLHACRPRKVAAKCHCTFRGARGDVRAARVCVNRHAGSGG